MGKKNNKERKKDGKLPKQIYVCKEDEFLDAQETLEDKKGNCVFSDGETIGVYQLVEVKKVRTRTTLE